jgi:GT2 family glycosyltransferase
MSMGERGSGIGDRGSVNDSLPTVSIIIPTYKNDRLLAQCLSSLHKLDYPARLVELIVVDNASSSETARLIATRFPRAKRLDMGKNTGFAAACNRGAAEASGEYGAFLNDDAVAEPGWLQGLLAGLRAGGEGTVCAASHIRSDDGREVEFSGASANLFGVGRPRPVWGWPDSRELPGEGSPILFASGGAMLVQRRAFLDAGGFDPNFFMYFEDVDLGWRLWVLGYKVVYAPGAVVRHVGGASGRRAGAHRRYALWECNSLATVLKNYEGGNMERLLSAGLMLNYKRVLLSAGAAFDPADYRLGGPSGVDSDNVERLPRISVAHLAAIDRFNALLPRLMEERRRIQSRRVRSDKEILPLLGRPYEPQFAGAEYAATAQALASALRLYSITREAAPNRVLLLATQGEADAAHAAANILKDRTLVALALVGARDRGAAAPDSEGRGYVSHNVTQEDPVLAGLIEQADAIVAYPGALTVPALAHSNTPKAIVGRSTTLRYSIQVEHEGDPKLMAFCLEPHVT